MLGCSYDGKHAPKRRPGEGALDDEYDPAYDSEDSDDAAASQTVVLLFKALEQAHGYASAAHLLHDLSALGAAAARRRPERAADVEAAAAGADVATAAAGAPAAPQKMANTATVSSSRVPTRTRTVGMRSCALSSTRLTRTTQG